jgi:preprotein translocase subunit Sss1
VTEEIDIGTLTALIKKEMRTVIREEFERVLKVVLAGVRVDTVPHAKRVITVTQKPHEEEHPDDMTQPPMRA